MLKQDWTLFSDKDSRITFKNTIFPGFEIRTLFSASTYKEKGRFSNPVKIIFLKVVLIFLALESAMYS